MIHIDDRIVKEDDGIFSDMIGKKLINISHDPFIYSNSVYGIAGIKTEDAIYKVTKLIEVRDYFGVMDDVAIFKVDKDVPENIHSYIQGETSITTPIGERIISVAATGTKNH